MLFFLCLFITLLFANHEEGERFIVDCAKDGYGKDALEGTSIFPCIRGNETDPSFIKEARDYLGAHYECFFP